MGKKALRLLPFFIFYFLLYYIVEGIFLPESADLLCNLVIFPLLSMIGALTYGYLFGFSFIMPLFSPLLQMTAYLIMYQEFAYIYPLIHLVMSLIGIGVGVPFYRSMHQSTKKTR